ncbi:Na+/H+ antiporter NhaC family protein [Pontibacter populi]|uniref:Na+/H+ antiporter NhaC family protein n=1 Tax=Pontibacter populi TaxID=890055 RepID=A0ABV1RT60_9BACT
MDQIQKTGGLALFPFLVFVFIFLGAGIVLNDFYALPSPVAVVCGIIAAFLILKGNINAKVDALVRGCGDSQIVTMCVIYLLAGAFAVVSKSIGGVDATVNLGLNYIPVQYLALGVFVLAAFLSTATGTSVGAIVALGPIVVGLAEQSDTSMPLMLGALLGGSMFGDNLSFISDTTIAATQTQECEMKDKFKVNFLIAGPAAFVTIGLLLFAGFQNDATQAVLPVTREIEFLKIAPYLLVLFLAVYGVNVFAVLIAGIVASGLVGIVGGELDVLLFSKKIYEGFTSMTEIFLLSMLTGGLAEMVRQAGGIQFLLSKANKFISGYRSSQVGVGLLVSGVNSAIANNTVSIVITGPVAKDISQRYHIDKRKTAAILDIFACIVQGLLPYGAQILIMLNFTNGEVSYLEVLPYAWYLYLLLFFTVLAILTPFIDKFLQQKPVLAVTKEAVVN